MCCQAHKDIQFIYTLIFIHLFICIKAHFLNLQQSEVFVKQRKNISPK